MKKQQEQEQPLSADVAEETDVQMIEEFIEWAGPELEVVMEALKAKWKPHGN